MLTPNCDRGNPERRFLFTALRAAESGVLRIGGAHYEADRVAGVRVDVKCQPMLPTMSRAALLKAGSLLGSL